jgi:divalent metal cation (Fe/Co/Zn/Cd) transporter
MFVVDFILSAIWAVSMFVTFLLNWQWILATAGGLIVCYVLIHLVIRLSRIPY